MERLLNKVEEAKQSIEDVKESFLIRRAAQLKLIVEDNKKIEFKKIDEIFTISGGGTPSKSQKLYWNGDIPWISAKDMKSDIITTTLDHITQKGLESTSTKLFRKNSIAMVVRSGILKHTLPVSLLGVEATVNQDLKVYDSGDDLLNKYFFWYVKANQSFLLNEYSKSGTTVNSIEFSRFKEHSIPIPSRKKMEWAIEEIEKITMLEDEIISKIKSNIELDLLKQSILSKAFKGGLGTNDSSEESSIELLTSILQLKK